MQRIKLEKAVLDGLQAAPSPTLQTAHVKVSVDDTGDVTLDGSVQNSADLSAAGLLVASVPGVQHVNNRLQVVPALPNNGTNGAQSSQTLVNQGMAFMDDGKYTEAIDCLTRALANDPNNESTRALLETARRAQKTEEQLLKKRQ